MKRPFQIALLVGLALLPIGGVAAVGNSPSVLARFGSLKQGNLPRIFTVYGEVVPNPSARDTLMAPLQTTISNVFVRSGQRVVKGAKLVQLAPTPASTVAYVQAKSALDVANKLVLRTRALVGSHLATEQQLAQAEQNYWDAQAALAALRSQGAEGMHDVIAPFSAIVSKLTATPGAIVSEGAPLVELVRPNGLMVKVGVVPSEANLVVEGDQVTLTPLGGGQALHGTVLFRGSIVEATSGLVPVDISAPPGKVLLGEMFRADIKVGKIHGYVVPHHAVLVDDIGAPYVVQSDKLVAKKVKVKVVGSFKDNDVVSGPLNPILPLVISGAYQMDNGTHIRVVPNQTVTATDRKGN